MSYCKSCGAYMPDWAEKCPACGAAREDKKEKKTGTETAGAQTGRASASSARDGADGGYRYAYKKSSARSDAGKRWSEARTGNAGKSGDKGTFTYESKRRAGERGTFRYEGGGGRRYDDEDYEYERPHSARDYEEEYRRDAKRNKLLAALCYFGPMFVLSWLLKPKSQFVKYHVNQGLVFFLMCVIINIFDFIPFMWVLNIFSVICFFCGVSNALRGRRKPLPAIGEITLIT